MDERETIQWAKQGCQRDLERLALARAAKWQLVVEAVDALAMADEATSEFYKAGVLIRLAGAWYGVGRLLWYAFQPASPPYFIRVCDEVVSSGQMNEVVGAMRESYARNPERWWQVAR